MLMAAHDGAVNKARKRTSPQAQGGSDGTLTTNRLENIASAAAGRTAASHTIANTRTKPASTDFDRLISFPPPCNHDTKPFYTAANSKINEQPCRKPARRLLILARTLTPGPSVL